MKQVQITITNDTGLHSRPADVFVRTAKLYQSAIEVAKDEKKANAKTILKVILLNVCQNDRITITADGPDEDAALTDLQALVESDFTKINPQVEI
jgi:phosphotransferase system HPr (HPr) family protein